MLDERSFRCCLGFPMRICSEPQAKLFGVSEVFEVKLSDCEIKCCCWIFALQTSGFFGCCLKCLKSGTFSSTKTLILVLFDSAKKETASEKERTNLARWQLTT